MRVIALLGCIPRNHHEPLKPKKCLVPTPCPISRSISKIRAFSWGTQYSNSAPGLIPTERTNLPNLGVPKETIFPPVRGQKRSFTSHTEYDPGDSPGPFMLEP